MVFPFGGTCYSGLDDGIVVYYPFDGSCDDVSGNGNNGNPEGSVQYVTGKFRQAVYFDGKGDKILVDDDASIEFGNEAFSVSFWVRTSVSGQNARILEKDDTGARQVFTESIS